MPTKKPGQTARGTQSGRPIMVLFDILGQRWTLRILWELRGGRLTFRQLRERCDDVSPTSLNKRLKSLRELALIDLEKSGFGYTQLGIELGEKLADMNQWSERWAKSLDR
tara:strand:+ start:8782 stop:9111 length:330 start_codon:yes stop_codon:yes gene_type:complete